MAQQLVPKDRIPWRHLALFGWLPSPLKVFASATHVRTGSEPDLGIPTAEI